MIHIDTYHNGIRVGMSVPGMGEKKINGVWWRWYMGHLSPSFCIVKAHGTPDEREIDAVPECGWNGKKRHKAWDHFAKWHNRYEREHMKKVWPNVQSGRRRSLGRRSEST